MKKLVLVTGGTGLLGSEVVRQLLKNNSYRVRVLTSRTGQHAPAGYELTTGNLITGAGLSEALKHVNIVIHCASNPRDAERTDVMGTSQLLAAMDPSAIEQLIYISIIGIDKSSYPYYQLKLRVEKMIEESGIAYSILRATQFHDFILKMIQALPVANNHIMVPEGLRFQPVSVPEVATALVNLAGRPSGRVSDIGGPEISSLEKLTATYLRLFGKEEAIKMVAPSTEREQMFTTGINLVPGNQYGKISWQQYLLELNSR